MREITKSSATTIRTQKTKVVLTVQQRS